MPRPRVGALPMSYMRPLDAEMPKQVDQTPLDRAIPVSRHPSVLERIIGRGALLEALTPCSSKSPSRCLRSTAGAGTTSGSWDRSVDPHRRLLNALANVSCRKYHWFSASSDQ
jgi:hypothetical protein